MPKAKARGPILFVKVVVDQWEWIHSEAKRKGQTISEFMRRLIDDYQREVASLNEGLNYRKLNENEHPAGCVCSLCSFTGASGPAERAIELAAAKAEGRRVMSDNIKHMIEHSPLGATAEAHLAIEHAVRALKSPHHDLPLAIALQFYPGDQAEALRLARFLADLEPEYRDDVLLIFAERFDVEQNPELSAAIQYCAQKFPVTQLRSQRPGVGHLEGSWGLFAGIADLCYRNYCHIWPWSSVFFAEADGIPLRWDWIDVLKRAHAENLARDKRVTGALMPSCGGHVNGTHVHHCSFWGDHPSLQVCRAGCAWDVFHAETFKAECGPAPGIFNPYGAQAITPSVFRTLANELGHAWLANVKDYSAWECAQELLHVDR